LSGALAPNQETKMLPRSGFPGHNAVFEKVSLDNGFTYWNVFEYVEGLQGRKVLIGRIDINEYGYDSPLLFLGVLDDDGLDAEAEEFFASHIESRFIYQLADFMRDIEKRMVESGFGHKLVE
jgi:hypothetical protein